jgi:phytoene dehydrogenase-like protein
MSRRAFVIGSGPNGLAAAIVLARAGVRVTVLEAEPTIGGGTRSAALTLPGFVHDICSAVHPLAVSSPVFRSLPLREHGLEWIHPPSPLAHPLDGGGCVLLDVNVRETAARLGRDGPRYRRLITPFTAQWDRLIQDVLAPPHWPKYPFSLARFCLLAAWPAAVGARALFRTREARAVIAGIAAHSCLPLETVGSGAFGWLLTLSAHSVGWPVARGGSQRIADALVSYLRSLGGEVEAHRRVTSLSELERGALALCDVSPRQLLRIGADRLPDWYLRKLEKYRYGPGVFKIDWALSAPIPWRNADCARAATVHLGGTLEEIAASERAPWRGQSSDWPFVLLTQPSLFDPSRAPAGQHTAWAYCHVPNGSREDMTARIEKQIERFAPGFRSVVLARHTMGPSEMEAHNANLAGGDINGGAVDLPQLLLRPSREMYRTPAAGVYLCSASTPPGGGVHGMCGYHAARWALRDRAGNFQALRASG